MKEQQTSDQAIYDKWWGEFLSLNIEEPGTAYRTNLILKTIKDLDEKDIVDVGCGSGELMRKISKNIHGVSLTGLDVSAVIIERDKRELPEADFFTINLNEASTPDKRFRVVVCSEVIEHVKNWENAVEILADLTEKGGYVIITTQAGKKHKHHRELGHLKHFKKEEIEDLFRKKGMIIVKSDYSGWPFMNLKNYLVSIFYKSIESSLFRSKKQSTLNKISFRIFGFLYAISSKKHGPQIFILAKK